jgi:hypothetical protein
VMLVVIVTMRRLPLIVVIVIRIGADLVVVRFCRRL